MPEKPRKPGQEESQVTMPHFGRFTSQLKPGQTIFVKGFLNGSNFDIGLHCGKKIAGPERDNIALVISGRLDEAKTSLCSLIDGEWGKEEKLKLGIQYKGRFEIRIRMREDCFEIWAQDRKVFDYEYVLPLDLVQYIYIVGEIDLYRCDWEGRYYPDPLSCRIPTNCLRPGTTIFVAGYLAPRAELFMIDLKSDTEVVLHLDTKLRKKVSFCQECPPKITLTKSSRTSTGCHGRTQQFLEGVAWLGGEEVCEKGSGARSQKSTEIEALVVRRLPGTWRIRLPQMFTRLASFRVLEKDEDGWNAPDPLYTPLHCKRQFQLLTRNSTIDGAWSEESESDVETKFPLERGKAFEMLIDIHADKFDIYANGKFLCAFKHRYPIEDITNMTVEGDADIHSISWS